MIELDNDIPKKKITELKVKKKRTTFTKDLYGNRIKGEEFYWANRTVKTIKSGLRFAHFFIDIIVFQIISLIVQFLFGFITISNSENLAAALTISLIYGIVMLLLYPTYYFVCENQWQTTLGKYLTKCIVIDEYGNKPAPKTLILRSLIRMVPFEAFSCMGDTYSYGWHDKWSKTFVVSIEEYEKIRALQLEQDVA